MNTTFEHKKSKSPSFAEKPENVKLTEEEEFWFFSEPFEQSELNT